MITTTSHLDPALNYFTERTQEMVDLISQLVRIDTPTGNRAALEKFVDYYRGLLEDSGARTKTLPGEFGPHLQAELVESGEAGPESLDPVLLVGHCDTVWGIGEAARRPPEIREGRLHGPGVQDMKASLGILVFLLRYLRERGDTGLRPLTIFLSSDEEGGSPSARRYLQSLAALRPVALVLEPPREDGGLKVSRKGVSIYRFSVRGQHAHAGIEPRSGASAIDELVHQILEIHRLRDPRRGITVNVGRIEGGTASNVVSAEAWAEIDIRFDRPEEGEEIDRRLRSLLPSISGTELSLEGGVVFPPMAPGSVPRELIEQAIAIAARMGIHLPAGSSGGGSDGSFLVSLGIPTLDGLGTDGTGAHTPDENILLDCLAPRAALLAHLVFEIRRP